MSTYSAEVESDLKWREEELTALKLLATQSSKGSIRQRSLLRALVALLYAHYEGFCAFCWESYVQHLDKKRATRHMLIAEVKASSLQKEIKRLRSGMATADIVKFLDSYQAFCKKERNLDISIDTESNLWPDRFRKINSNLGLATSCIDIYNTEMVALVGRRNGIAHGEKLTIPDLKAYDGFEHCAFLVMQELALTLNQALEDKVFVKKRYRSKIR